MREIKFRAWHKSREEWVDINKHFSFNTDGELYQTDFKPIYLMQYTGLKDKNGVEIYEGDLLKHYKVGDFDKENPIIGEVTFNSNGVYAGYWPVGFADESEVIGNIYENKELLDE